MRKTLTFDAPRHITPPGLDGIVYRFPFAAVDSEMVGMPEEQHKTTYYRIDVRISRSRRIGWAVSDEELVKVLFEIGKRKIVETLQSGDLPEQLQLDVTTATHPAQCPFDPSRIKNPEGAVIEVEVRSRIGFH